MTKRYVGPYSLSNVGTLPSVTGLTVSELGGDYIKQTILTLTNVNLTVVHSGGTDGIFTVKLYDFPSCGIYRLGGSINVTLSETSANITDTTAFEVAVGTGTQTAASTTVNVSNGTNLISAQSIANLSSSGLVQAFQNTATSVLDGVSTTRSVYFNGAGIETSTGNGTMVANGTITLLWGYVPR